MKNLTISYSDDKTVRLWKIKFRKNITTVYFNNKLENSSADKTKEI